jgi:hypothetical protein
VRARLLFAAVALAALAAGSGSSATGRLPAGCSPPPAGAAATARTLGVLRSGRDVLGERLLRAPGGPTLSRAQRLLPPLLLARGPRGRPLTESGVYYLPFADPPPPGGTASVDLHVADGGQIVARRVGGPSLRVLVGPKGDERYGSCTPRLAQPRLRDGWLPVLETAYADAAGSTYTQESFATRLPGAATPASLVRLSVHANAGARVRFASSAGPGVDVPVAAGDTRTIEVAWRPRGARLIDDAAYATALDAYSHAWQSRVAAAASISVPEDAVTNAERALLVQELLLGWRYSVGNPYEEFSFPESPDVAQVLVELGLPDAARAILETSLQRTVEPYVNWKRGENLEVWATYFRLTHDRAAIGRATPVLAAYVRALSQRIGRSGAPILARERFSSDIPDRVYGFHAQAVAWAGLRTIAQVWRATGRAELASEAQRAATRLERGLRAAVASSARRLPDGSLFVPARLLDRETAYRSLVQARAGSYWNLVMPFGFATGFFAPHSPDAARVIAYMLGHGSRLLGLVRAGAYALYGRSAPFPVSGTDQVYGVNVSRFLADNDRPDQLVLSLYGQLAAAMTPGTFVAGEGASVAPLDGRRDRAMYLPPNAAANAAFLETLRVMLVHETRDAAGAPRGIELAYATPRAWLQPGRRIAVANMPTSFGPVSFTVASGAHDVRVHVDVPARATPARLLLRLRLPDGRRLHRVTLAGRSVRFDPRTATIDLSGERGSLDLVAST